MTDTRRSFHEQLDEIRREIVVLAAHVTEAVPRATDALLAADHESAQAVIDHDRVVDALALDIEERTCRALATQQPMAGDLRSLVSALRIVADVERSGDLAANIAKARRASPRLDPPPRLRGLIEQMGEQAATLYRMAMDAYTDGDAALAASLVTADDRLDDLHDRYREAVVEWGDRGGEARDVVQLALVGRFYERIGDHAVNIGQRVRYLLLGELPEHGAGAAPVVER